MFLSKLRILQRFPRCSFICLGISAIKSFFSSASLPTDVMRSTSENFDENSSQPLTHDLPDEILSRIFLLGSRMRNDHDTLLSSHETLLSITHVCSGWRLLALSSGELWTEVIIVVPVDKLELDRARAWLDRSGSRQVEITIDVRDPEWDWVDDNHSVQWLQMQAAMGIVLPHVERWKEMTILADNWTPLHAFLHYTQNMDTPQLKKLILKRCNPYYAAPDTVFSPIQSRVFLPLFGGREGSMPMLEALELGGVHVDWVRHAAFKGLTSLSFGYHAKDVLPSLDDFCNIMTSSPNLQNLSIIGWGPDPVTLDAGLKTNDVHRSIKLSKLTHLELGIMIVPYAIKLLTLFDLSSLQNLTLDDVSRYDDPRTIPSPDFDFGPLFDSLLNPPIFQDIGHGFQTINSSPFPLSQLQNLSLQNIQYMKEEHSLRRFLQHTRDLRYLTIHDCVENSLKALLSDEHGIPCAALENLIVEACNPHHLAQTINQRRNGNEDVTGPNNITFQQYVTMPSEDDHESSMKLDYMNTLTMLGIHVLTPIVTESPSWENVDDSDNFVAALMAEI